MRNRSTSSQAELDVLARLLGSDQLPVQQAIAKEVGVAQSLISRARNGKLTRITDNVRKLIDYAHSRAGAADLEVIARASVDADVREAELSVDAPVVQVSKRAAPVANYSKEAREGLKAYLKDGYDPRLIVEQLAVLRRAQQVRRAGRK